MPILYPIALLSYLIMYFLNIYMVHYVFRRPLEYDGTLNKLMLSQLKIASLMSLAMNYWLLSNPNFFNQPQDNKAYHYLNPIFAYKERPVAFPTLIMFYCCSLYWMFSKKLISILNNLK